MRFSEFIRLEDAGVVGSTVSGKWGDDGEHTNFELKGINSKYTAPDRPVKLPKRKKYARYFQKPS